MLGMKSIKILEYIWLDGYQPEPSLRSKIKVTKDEIKDVQSLNLELKVNGKVMQQGNTNDMIFKVLELVSYLSYFMTLKPGDIITTGTPPGVGMGRKPQVFLKAGDMLLYEGAVLELWREPLKKGKPTSKTVATLHKANHAVAKELGFLDTKGVFKNGKNN